MHRVCPLIMCSIAFVAWFDSGRLALAQSAAPVTVSASETSSTSAIESEVFSYADQSAGITLSPDAEDSRAIYRLSSGSLLGGDVSLSSGTPNNPPPVMTLKEGENSADGDFTFSSNLGTLNREIAPSRVEVWTRANVDQSSNWTSGNQNDSSSAGADLGIDYLAMPGLLVGSLVQIDSEAQVDSDYSIMTRTAGSSDVWTAGPYMALQLFPHLIVDARIGIGGSEEQIEPVASDRDAFSTVNTLSQVDASGAWSIGNFNFEPTSRMSFFEGQQGSFKDANDELIPSQIMTIGEGSVGPKISYDSSAIKG